jgi:hypothetical protein
MRILVTSDNSGLIETVRNTISIHSIKKDAYARRLNEVGVVFTLYDYFQQVRIYIGGLAIGFSVFHPNTYSLDPVFILYVTFRNSAIQPVKGSSRHRITL